MEALSLKVRSDLRRHRQTLLEQHHYRWRKIQVIVLISSIILLFVHVFVADWPYRNLLTIYLFAPIFFLSGLERFLDGLPQKNVLTLAFLSILIALSTAAGATNPRLPTLLFDHSGWAGLLIPLFVIFLLLWLIRKNPTQARRYSLLPYKPAIHIFTGLFFGIGMAIHFILIARFLPDTSLSGITLQPEYAVWLFGVLAGLIIPAEELLFRGVAFSIVFDGIGSSILKTLLRITALNLIPYLPIVIYLAAETQQIASGVLALVYKGILSAISAYVIYRWRNLYVTCAANLAFALIVIHRFVQ